MKDSYLFSSKFDASNRQARCCNPCSTVAPMLASSCPIGPRHGTCPSRSLCYSFGAHHDRRCLCVVVHRPALLHGFRHNDCRGIHLSVCDHHRIGQNLQNRSPYWYVHPFLFHHHHHRDADKRSYYHCAQHCGDCPLRHPFCHHHDGCTSLDFHLIWNHPSFYHLLLGTDLLVHRNLYCHDGPGHSCCPNHARGLSAAQTSHPVYLYLALHSFFYVGVVHHTTFYLRSFC
mmetsp:Transcript_36614/g.88732  ORF Transcript_36614/g.88732 Transcript_36614/m.88732 type:complete len:230 (+) Transcript_36614:19-708(+)